MSTPTPPSRSRRGEDPRPYPGAPTRTRAHRPRTNRHHARPQSPRSTAETAPASVWAPHAVIDPTQTWAPALIRQVVTAFSEHGARVGLLPWPTTQSPADEQADDALAAIEHLGRTSVLEHLPAPRSAGTGSA
ncbi:hypothetical protein AB8O55_30090, partial [Saccharopolyspora cebuensis]